MLACEDDGNYSNDLQGSWGLFTGTEGTYTFSGDNFTWGRSMVNRLSGTYTCTSTHITFNTTHYRLSYDGEWLEITSSDIFHSLTPDFLKNNKPVTYSFNEKKTRLYLDGDWYGCFKH